MTPRSLAEMYRRYQERSASIFRADDNAVYLSVMSVNFYQTARRHLPEDGDANGEFVFATVTTLRQCSNFFFVKPIKKNSQILKLILIHTQWRGCQAWSSTSSPPLSFR